MNDHDNHQVPEEIQEFAGKLFEFARTGDVTLLEYVDNGVDVNLANQDGNTFLMLAAYSGHAELVEGLVERGADVDKLNARGQSPLAGVIFKKEDAIVDLLLEAGADPRAGHPDAIATAQMFGRADLAEKMG
ncbi:ankyrin repeat domain-containing protein [Corynebacterium qintianiae]|uniref:Ankyrin repeat domain-containing protein n=1 Tax=Corynebacterium qintianiae TaxID=2709392 RepID=A0A7T0KN24_9CORY|nr:ankyrin repeat domain-containing protein [Corynebacterium qintianiae]QPK82833.1 ankyrin repeat domain-containing protein [Corynebacterium qintianiae]